MTSTTHLLVHDALTSDASRRRALQAAYVHRPLPRRPRRRVLLPR